MRKTLALSLLLGIMAGLAFPPVHLGFLAYGMLIPLLFLLDQASLKQTIGRGYLAGLFYFLFTVFWISWATVPGFFGALIVLPLYFIIFSTFYYFFRQKLGFSAIYTVPFIWTSIEYLLSLSEFCFPWAYLGYTQTHFLPLLQYADITGVYGVSFWVAIINVALFIFWKRVEKRRMIALIILALFAVPGLYGWMKIQRQTPTEETTRIALIQGNVSIHEKWQGQYKLKNFQRYKRLTITTLDQEPNLIVWPETALPFHLRGDPRYNRAMHQFADSAQAAILTGAIDYSFNLDGSYEHYNAALAFRPQDEQIQQYYKQKLAPFSERVPYKNYFPFNMLKDLLYDLGIGDYSIGKKIYNFKFGGRSKPDSTTFNAGVAICYESVFPDHVRQYVKNGANVLIVMTNDGWFGPTSGPFQHKQIAVLRAIENRRAVSRCANTGISCFIDTAGRVRQQARLNQTAVIVDDVHLHDSLTFYVKYGNVFARCVVGLVALAVLLTFFKRKV